MPLPIHKMLLRSYKADIKQISSGNNNITIFWVIFAGTVLNFNPRPSLSSMATDDRKQFQCLNVVLNTKTVPLCLEFN